MMSLQKMGKCRSAVRRKRSNRWEVSDRLYQGSGATDGRYQIVCTKEAEQRVDGNGAFVRMTRSGGWEGTNRLYEGNGADVWCGLRKLYRLSENTL